MKSPIENDCLKLSIEGQTETKLVPNVLLQVLVRELHNSMVSPPEYVRLKEAIDSDNTIIISDSTLCNILHHQLKNMIYQYKFMCCCECCISTKIMHSSVLKWRNLCLKHLKDRSKNT